MNQRYWVIDTEGNGANPSEIIQLGMVEMTGNDITGRTHLWHFRPTTPITPYVERMTGITNASIADQPNFSEKSEEILDAIGDTPIIAHAADADYEGLKRMMPQWKPDQVICTLRIARQIYGKHNKNGLDALGKRHNLIERAQQVVGGRRHNALTDAMICALLYQELVAEYPERMTKLIKSADLIKLHVQKELNQQRQAMKRQQRENARHATQAI